ncbi:hypothetical protein [Paenibacillus glacialis]|uniref:Uncharacterized protein n=1 Tax=Paenibacillus glacialis TaxID=494026 RepID=A0A162MCB2_9BACL|nr:hypothetical protein [Paenibacillus glacialis]OAB42013.1 hypothetical protein PGLA_14430 [Paenibacillus glacialis]
MSEAIDFYVSLLDDKSANEILNKFKETVPGFLKQPPLKLKKNYINQIFRRQTPKMRRKKADPFFQHFHSGHDLNDLSEATSKEEFLARISSKDIADHLKVALAIKYDIKLVEEILPELQRKLENSEKLFDYTLEIKTDEQALKLLSQNLYLNDHQKESYFKSALLLLSSEQTKQFKVELNKVKEMSLKEFYAYYQNVQDHGLLSFAYAIQHDSLEYSIRYGLVSNFLYDIARKGKEAVDELEQSQIHKTKLQEEENSLNELKEKLKVAEESKKDIVVAKKSVNNLQKELEKVKVRLADKELEIVQLDDINMSKMEEQKELYQSMIQEKDQENLNLRRQLESWKVDVTERINGFCILYESSDVSLARCLFPEVIFVTFKDWEKQKDSLIKNGLTQVYIQQNGISSKKLFSLQKSMNGMHYSTFVIHDHKSLIELLSIWKRGEESNV